MSCFQVPFSIHIVLLNGKMEVLNNVSFEQPHEFKGKNIGKYMIGISAVSQPFETFKCCVMARHYSEEVSYHESNLN